MNLRTTFGVILFAVALVTGQQVLAESAGTAQVWVAVHDLAPNSTLGSSDLKLADAHLPSQLLARYAPATIDPSGAVVIRPVAAGELLPRGAIVTGRALVEGRSITLPVTPEHAVGGQLRAGDRVDIFATFDSGDVRARTTLLVRSVDVVDVVREGGFAGSGESIIGITVAVTSQDAARLAFATHAGDIDVVRVDGVTGASSVPTVRWDDFR